MIRNLSDQSSAAAGKFDIPCPDFPITWAGPGRHDDEFCFGSEDGRLRFTTPNGGLIAETLLDKEHSEAVNGVVFSGNVVAVSSRSEVIFWEMLESGARARPAFLYCGAHGIMATPSGHFIAPMGLEGVMKVHSLPKEGQPITRLRADELLDYYAAVSIDAADGDLLVCAVRKNGIATIESTDGDSLPMLKFTIHGELDVIDVCSLSTAEAPRAAAALCRDGTLLLFNDILDQASRVALRFDEIQGMAYRVLSARESMIVLTSRGIYTLSGLAERARRGRHIAPINGIPIPGIPLIPVEAIDANLVGDRWLLVAAPDAVLRYDVLNLVCQLESDPTHDIIDFNPNVLHPSLTPGQSQAHRECVYIAA